MLVKDFYLQGLGNRAFCRPKCLRVFKVELSVATFRQHGSFRPPECQAGFLDGRSLLGVLFVVLGAQRDFCVFFCGSLFNLVLNAHLQSHVFSLELLEVFQFEREDSHVEAQRLSFLRGILENKISK